MTKSITHKKKLLIKRMKNCRSTVDFFKMREEILEYLEDKPKEEKKSKKKEGEK